MAYGFAFVVIAFGGSLFYKGYKGYSWPQFYAAVLGGGGATTGGAKTQGKTTSSTSGGVKTIVHAVGP
jgi:hypothetical protein